MNIVKKQHYVWRHYLRAWSSTNDHIWAYLRGKHKLLPLNLMGVAQQQYFYQLRELSAGDGDFLRQFIASTFPSFVRPLVEDLVRLSEEYTILKQKLAATPPTRADVASIEEQLREIEINSLEKIHGAIEASGMRLVACRSLADLQGLEGPEPDGGADGLLTAVSFMCVQYFRTRVRKNAVLRSFPLEWRDRIERYWHILSFGLATTLARNIMADTNRQFCFLENTAPVEFITGDQPVINLLDKQTDEQGEPTGLALYYPLAPTCALLVHFPTPAEEATEVTRFTATTVDIVAVAAYNRAILQRSEQFVFGSNRTILDDLLTTPAG